MIPHGSRPFTSQEIRQRYDRFARWYDLGEIPAELMGAARLRRTLLRSASGRVLEVAVGTGKNLRHYPGNCQLTAVDLSPAMLAVARGKAARLGLHVTSLVMDAEALSFPDHTFDAVVSTLGLCTFPHPVVALREMARVCRPNGRILLLEHGRSDREWLGRWQDRTAEGHAKQLGCHWNRRPLELVREAGLSIRHTQRAFFGILHVLELAPSRAAP